ncbi:undecaprenyldiphospho-muramoylpentapeptide beta-N-acetylglucosaminyltransferase [Lactobacillus xylocopicola]|uniref:UDP-N-acetylglucosamine--N-acetylmuramyl-(pentapeptide) pyrophosphoryl-undecaprenol N-acetylglucosamine transferase n=1 Tax=Lactobacillus xylocopicola TaxID=2976676 RepID=A0ABM8BH05_9LACO|nr:undecaprenyldiphospho-muramoylpentapeptide beta-N-acetylglucosaminyltransferase [Lactobacillus xylocopicola]BDR60398.1 UDP-N-acetylglucosamine--N-acetylmuramyl-(pentapeptide) pyrophosphoryl-undecaprenol N-acetylglucosamine transferase [Lactobacillus xylocopicola]
MRVIFTGGGTGGHIYPIMAIIEQLKQRGLVTDEDILFVGTAQGLEAKIVPAAGVNFKTIEVQGFSSKKLLSNLTTINKFVKAVKQAKQIIGDFKPDVVVGTGGYVSGATVYAAAKLGIPTMIHESNSVVGVANKFLGHYVDKICYTFDDAAKQFTEKKKLVKTGNPRSQQVLNLSSTRFDLQDKWRLNEKIPTVLIFGGSRGALAINRVMLQSLTKLKQKPYQLIWVTGNYYYQEISEKLAGVDYGNRIKIVPYVKDMPALLPKVTCVVARSGATSIAEFTALGVPAILIPSPNVTHNHQMKNALDLERAGAATVIAESDVNTNNFISSIDHILLDHKYADEMSTASKKLGIPDASDQVINVMKEIAK